MSKKIQYQEVLISNSEQKIHNVEEYKFEPIKGYPMLNWKGKRPFESTQYYPAQLKESYGNKTKGWLNKIFWGDNLQVMSHLLKELRGKVDLVYIDPPFDSNADYKKEIKLKNKEIENDYNSFEEKQYSDIWNNDEYLQFIYERIILCKELLSINGSMYVHCDWHKSHFIRLIIDEIFGSSNFRNEIIWKRGTVKGAKAIGNQFARNHDSIMFYSNNATYVYNREFIPYTEEYIKQRYTKNDNDGRGPFTDQAIGTRSKESIKELLKENRIFYTREGKMRIKYYLNELKGIALDDTWIDISEVNSMSLDNWRYPTQKPDTLLHRIILASSNPGDLVFDCFMGSGTTQAVAMKLGRRFIGADINLGSIQTTTKRLLDVASDLENGQLKIGDNELPYYTGFEVYNVNNYDIFRNPVEAKDILMKALEIEPLINNSIYDGEKDGRKVKIMPVNRIATRADLTELISNFDYKSFEKKNSKNPGKPVEHLLIVCMGHEPDLAATLKQEMKKLKFEIDVEIVDILRDKTKLEFKRDSDADIEFKNGKLIINQFYPMNLLSKLSMRKESVKNWKELVESVMIDFNYDGKVLKPQITDIPDDDFVKGKYNIPANAKRIKIKITDLLSESFEAEHDHGK